jgi:Arc/MetJ-type ribon-helix-helix transcriptional regulator
MKAMQIELPDELADQVEALIQREWFTNEAELTRLALTEFFRRHQFEIEERFQLEDIEWARRFRKPREAAEP